MPKKYAANSQCIDFFYSIKNVFPFYGKNALISQYQFLEVNSEIKADFIGSFENLRVDLELVEGVKKEHIIIVLFLQTKISFLIIVKYVDVHKNSSYILIFYDDKNIR